MTVSSTTSGQTNESSTPVQLRMGQRVVAEDGPFGELADIVIDPATREVTHLIVEPHGKHLQSRLVPLGLTRVADVITVELDLQHLRALARVSFSELIRIGEPIDLGGEWDIGDLTIHALPYWSAVFPGPWAPEADAEFDRIPKGQCEIRRTSAVRSSDGYLVGHVEGMVVAEEHMTHVLMSSGVRGFRHHAVVPLWAIDQVTADEIFLNVPRIIVDDLPDAAGLKSPDGTISPAASGGLQRQIGTVATRTTQVVQGLLGRFGRS